MNEKLVKKVMYEKGTEPAFSGEHWNNNRSGKYYCASCDQLLFDSSSKLDSSVGYIGLQGWPAFDESVPGAISFKEDLSHGMMRTEATCSKCGIHLGHVFDDEKEKTGKHFCVNSCTLDFKPKEK